MSNILFSGRIYSYRSRAHIDCDIPVGTGPENHIFFVVID